MVSTRRIFVTGATGFVGRAVVPALRAHGYAVRCLVRRGSELDLRGLEAIERVEGDVLSPEALERDMAGCDTVVHLVGIIREAPAALSTFERIHTLGTVNVLEAAAATGVRRYVHMSALGARRGARSRYHQTKWDAEESARAVQLEATVKHAYEVGGPDTATMVELLDLIGAALGRTGVRKMHVPIGLIRPLARLLHRLPGFPITPDQLEMLEEDNVCDPQPFYTTFGLAPVRLATGL